MRNSVYLFLLLLKSHRHFRPLRKYTFPLGKQGKKDNTGEQVIFANNLQVLYPVLNNKEGTREACYPEEKPRQKHHGGKSGCRAWGQSVARVESGGS